MNCKDAEKAIPYFLKDELNERQLRQFMSHIEGCPECKEELSIQYLVVEGMARLEEGGTFDLQAELERVLDNYDRALRINRRADVLLFLTQFVSAAVIIWIAGRVIF